MLVAQISDTHILTPESDQPAAELRADCLRRCVADVNQQQPDAVIFTGDTVQHGRPEEYARLRELLAPLEAPLYIVPGNRDDKYEMRAAFSDHAYLPKSGELLQYVIEAPAVRLVAIDSTSHGERKGVFCPARQAWLEEVLSDQPEQPTLLFIHHPPFDVGDHYVGGYRRPAEAAALADIVSRHAQVAGLVCGHVHWLIEREWAGTQARIMPSVAVDLRKGIDETEARGRPVYLLHRLSRATGLVSQARRTS
ncbi:MAG: phosphodiesterase [Gammaproteobacteria bacterium]|nr:phosphodiesterase [Gammaproteobacteria bacterium]MBT8109472.1 phosphodiesterase [Gammaproteobacteria bacterium]NND46354.1 phosphodiesterase [Woeseiaceae bacterium]NNL44174.1 phosphodiesterase [Woeseiaceae bacterium]